MSPNISQRFLDDRLQLCLDGGIESLLLKFWRSDQLGMDSVVMVVVFKVLAKGGEKTLFRGKTGLDAAQKFPNGFLRSLIALGQAEQGRLGRGRSPPGEKFARRTDLQDRAAASIWPMPSWSSRASIYRSLNVPRVRC